MYEQEKKMYDIETRVLNLEEINCKSDLQINQLTMMVDNDKETETTNDKSQELEEQIKHEKDANK